MHRQPKARALKKAYIVVRIKKLIQLGNQLAIPLQISRLLCGVQFLVESFF